MISDPSFRKREQDPGKVRGQQVGAVLAQLGGPRRVLPDVRLDPVRVARVAVGRVHIHPVPLGLLDHLHLPRAQVVLVLVDVGGVDGKQRFFALELPVIAAVFPQGPPRQGNVLAIPRRDRPVLVPRLLGSRVVQVFPQPCHFLGRGAPCRDRCHHDDRYRNQNPSHRLLPPLSGLLPDAKNERIAEPNPEAGCSGAKYKGQSQQTSFQSRTRNPSCHKTY